MRSIGEVSSLSFYCQMSLIMGRGKKENREKEEEEDISIIPQVPIASLVVLPYYKYVIFAGHLSSEIKLRLCSQPKKKTNCTTWQKQKLLIFNLSIDIYNFFPTMLEISS